MNALMLGVASVVTGIIIGGWLVAGGVIGLLIGLVALLG